ncbi:MAG: class I SAM-dependent methyltransferase, partial [Maribacter sp.]
MHEDISALKKYTTTKDYLVSGEVFSLYLDAHKEMLITHPQPNELEKYYNSDAYISHKDSSHNLIDKIYHYVKNYTLYKKEKLIRDHAPYGKTLLDIGVGTGDFMQTTTNRDWETTGVEPNAAARGKAQKKGMHVVPDLNSVPVKHYDVITLWHVLEHVPDLKQSISKIDTLLSPEGTLIIAVPNYKSYDAQLYKSHWAAFDTPRHLWHFSQKSISLLFEQHNLSVVETVPMYFDAFYVSLLSEKNKTGKNNYIK